MPRQEAAVQINQFIGGFNTEANPLNFPPNASVDEQNFTINLDGSRSRRFGLDQQVDATTETLSLVTSTLDRVGRNTHTWDAPGGYSQEQFLVVQLGNIVNIHQLYDGVPSDSPLYTYTFDNGDRDFSFTTFDNYLVAVVGDGTIYMFEYDGTNVSLKTTRIKIRDLFGVYENIGQSDRPVDLSDEHLYNLRNQTFGIPRMTIAGGDTTITDTIRLFYDSATSELAASDSYTSEGIIEEEGSVGAEVSAGPAYPSNADDVNTYLYADANNNSDRLAERYDSVNAVKNAPYSTPAPKGFFIIDLLDRGTSRLEEEQKNIQRQGARIEFEVTSLPADTTSGGATVVTEYAGRVWFAGFSSEVTDGDTNSPALSRYVAFSQLTTKTEDVGKCYQSADPTSHIDPDLVDTDGGLIKISGADQIIGLEVINRSLFVFANNGVWRIIGTDENGFTATGYSVEKVTDFGCNSEKSIVSTGSVGVYWSEYSIFLLQQEEVSGNWVVQDLAENSIKSYYQGLSIEQRRNCFAFYDRTKSEVTWGLTTDDLADDELTLLTYNARFGAFTKSVVTLPEGVVDAVCGVFTVSELSNITFEEVTVDGEVVTVDGDAVQARIQTATKGPEGPLYLMITDTQPTTVDYSFAKFRTDIVEDWTRLGSAVESDAYLIASRISGGDVRLRKDIPYLTVYLGNEGDGGSSCKVSARWNWTNNILSGKWSTKREAYRWNSRDEYEDFLQKRLSIRGSGRSVALRFDAGSGLPLRIYGWDFNLQANERE